MVFNKMISLIILLWILPSIEAGGWEDHFQTVYDAVNKKLDDQMIKIQLPIFEEYTNKYASIDPPTVVVLQKTNNSVYILDPNASIYGYVQDYSVGLLLSDLMNVRYMTFEYESEISIHKAPSDVEVFSINNGTRPCYGYNLTLADSDNGTLIEAVTTDKCGGPTLRSFIFGKPSEFYHLKAIALQSTPITELTVEDLIHFPELQRLLLVAIPITFMENGLLCYNLNITVLHYINSNGSLTVFPRQIFNCTMLLKLVFFPFKRSQHCFFTSSCIW